jgi:replicative DNA helicase
MNPSIIEATAWETDAEEMRFIGACLEFIGPVGKQPEKLFKLLTSGVESDWFTNELNQSLYEAIEFYAPSIGGSGTIIKQKAILEKAEQISGDSGWALSVARQCIDATYDFHLQNFIDEEIPLWRVKLKKPKILMLLGKLELTLAAPPTPEKVVSIETIISKVQGEWEDTSTARSEEEDDVFNSTREQVLTPRKQEELVSSGLEILDYVLGGGFGGPGSLEEGKLITIMARPGQGKTLLALNVAMRVAVAGYKVGFWELEMQRKQLALRMMAAYDHELCRFKGYKIGGDLTYDMLRRHDVTGEVRERYAETDFTVLQDNVKMYYDSKLTAEKLANQMRVFCRRFPDTRLFVVDHIGLLSMSSGMNDTNAIGEITRTLKLTATELGVDVIQLCQLNRGVEARENKMPTMSDGRGSGKIEEDSDVVLGLMRPYYYDPAADKTLLNIGALKNRQGVTGVFDATVHLPCCAIHDRSSAYPTPVTTTNTDTEPTEP